MPMRDPPYWHFTHRIIWIMCDGTGVTGGRLRRPGGGGRGRARVRALVGVRFPILGKQAAQGAKIYNKNSALVTPHGKA